MSVSAFPAAAHPTVYYVSKACASLPLLRSTFGNEVYRLVALARGRMCRSFHSRDQNGSRRCDWSRLYPHFLALRTAEAGGPKACTCALMIVPVFTLDSLGGLSVIECVFNRLEKLRMGCCLLACANRTRMAPFLPLATFGRRRSFLGVRHFPGFERGQGNQAFGKDCASTMVGLVRLST